MGRARAAWAPEKDIERQGLQLSTRLLAMGYAASPGIQSLAAEHHQSRSGLSCKKTESLLSSTRFPTT